MPGHIEPVVGYLRVGGAYGEPWTWASGLRYLSPTVVVVEAVGRAPTFSEWRQAVTVMREAGITTFRFVRCRADGLNESHEWSTNKRGGKSRRRMSSNYG